MTLSWYKYSWSTPDAFQHVTGYKPALELVPSRTRLNLYGVDIGSLKLMFSTELLLCVTSLASAGIARVYGDLPMVTTKPAIQK